MHGTLVPCGGSIPPVPYIRAGLSHVDGNRTECFLTLIFAMDAAGGLGGLIYAFRTTGVLPGSIPGSAVKAPVKAGEEIKGPPTRAGRSGTKSPPNGGGGVG